MMKKILSLIVMLSVITALILSLASAVSAKCDYSRSFKVTDAAADWVKPYINNVIRLGIMNGTSSVSDGESITVTFNPNDLLTREQFTAILSRLQNTSADITVSSFTDVKASEWYTESILWAEENSIVEGIGEGKFGIGLNITRQELAVMLARYSTKFESEFIPSTVDVTEFADSDSISEWAADSVDLLRANNIIVGDENKQFRPNDFITRAEVASIITRFIYFNTEIIKTVLPSCDDMGKVVIRGTEFPVLSKDYSVTNKAQIAELFEYLSAAEILSVTQYPARVGSSEGIALYDNNNEFITWFLQYSSSSIILSFDSETIFCYTVADGYMQPLLDITAN